MNKKILCIGNALVDIIKVMDDDKVLSAFNLPKGSMQLIDFDTRKRFMDATKGYSETMVSGGSAANTANALANLGIEVGYIGMVGSDSLGEFYVSDMHRNKIKTQVFKSDKQGTGTALTLVSSDGERTFATYLGAATELSADILLQEYFVGYDYVHIEGYLISNRRLMEAIFKFAENIGAKISLDLASYNVVEENSEFLNDLCQRCNIIFANEDEATAFTGLEAEKAVEEIAKYSDIAIVKIGAKGSLISDGKVVKVDAEPSKQTLDTTGAGDVYAGGFLAALMQGKTLSECGKWGSITAGNVIEVLGTKMDADRWTAIRQEIAAL
ncbi:MAG: adenosine kinase [Bacteroidales bacterium]|nr:adenosine kinase [Bacteroidales bacterium]